MPLPATSYHDCANPLFDAQRPFTLRPEPGINIKNSIDNGVLIFQEEAFEEMVAKFTHCSDHMNDLLPKQGGKSLNRWMDSQEACRQLNISLRTLQDYCDNGIIACYQLGGKILYRGSDFERMLTVNYREAFR